MYISIFKKYHLVSVSVSLHINLFRLFNVKAILEEGHFWYYLTHSWRDKGIHNFPNGISFKVNIIAQLEFILVYYVQHISLYTMETFLNSEFKLFYMWWDNIAG